MDPLKFTTLAHRGLSVCNPLGEEVLDDALAVMAQRLPSQDALVLDVGCGKGELLLRLAERYAVDGTGVDSNAAFIEQARAEAALRLARAVAPAEQPAGAAHGRLAPLRVRPHDGLPGVPADGLPGRVTLHAEPFADFLARLQPDIARFDGVLCVGASQALGTPREAPARLARLLAQGGVLMLGEGYWRREPAPEYLALLGATRQELTDHEGNRELGQQAGLTCFHAVETPPEDFERYERRYAEAIESWVAANAGDPDAGGMLQRIRAWRAAYERWGRDTLGFGLYLFRIPPDPSGK
jgi:SAM-dependent methyltransferase